MEREALRERQLFVGFPSNVPLRRIDKILKTFCETASLREDGYPVRVVSLGEGNLYADSSGDHKSPIAVFAVWYPTDNENDIPITVDDLQGRLERFVKERLKRPNVGLQFVKQDHPTESFNGTLITSTPILERRSVIVERMQQRSLGK